MKVAYPVIFTELDSGNAAFVPDINIDAQGDTLAETIEMARDAIGIMGIDMEDDKREIPLPSTVESIVCGENEFVSMVDIDFTSYRKANERRAVRKNVSLL